MNRVCKKCGETKPLNQFTANKRCLYGRTHRCTASFLKYLREWGSKPEAKVLRHNRHRRLLDKMRAEGGERVEKRRIYRNIATKKRMHTSDWDKNYRREYKRRFYQNHRVLALMRYGGRCVCCGEDELVFLTIDHINGGGHAERRSQKGDWHLQLSRGPIRDDLRVLCFNCNCGRERNNDVCPHESRLRLVVNNGS